MVVKWISNIFNNKKDQAKNHIINLIDVAFADGNMDNAEMELIKSTALKSGITDEEFQEIISNPRSAKTYIPSDEKSRVEQLTEMVKIMIVDREIEEKEVKVCKKVAIQLNLAPQIVDELIDSLVLESRKQTRINLK
ncbi:MAG: hypothetical protein JJU28_11325 [Cyclobacteriaceae bacterium]|nr:hypothetical protein [Cyclobacteriaceae bacterium]